MPRSCSQTYRITPLSLTDSLTLPRNATEGFHMPISRPMKNHTDERVVAEASFKPIFEIKNGELDPNIFLLEFQMTREFARTFTPSAAKREFAAALTREGFMFKSDVWDFPFHYDFESRVAKQKPGDDILRGRIHVVL